VKLQGWISQEKLVKVAEKTVICNFFLKKGTLIKGEARLIKDSQIWTAEASPYIIEEDIEILRGAQLTIKPGAVLKFRPKTKLLIKGQLFVDMEADSPPVLFTSAQEGDYWLGIEFSPEIWGTHNLLYNSRITLAEIGVRVNSPNAKVEIVNNIIEKCKLYGVLAENFYSLLIRKNEIRNNGGIGVCCERNTSSIEILQNKIENNFNTGIYLLGCDEFEIVSNDIDNSYKGPQGVGLKIDLLLNLPQSYTIKENNFRGHSLYAVAAGKGIKRELTGEQLNELVYIYDCYIAQYDNEGKLTIEGKSGRAPEAPTQCNQNVEVGGSKNTDVVTQAGTTFSLK
jgi:hypothetical protein